MTPALRLRQGVAVLGLDLTAAVEEKLLAFLALLRKWNGVYNLTAIRDLDAMVTHHVLDSLAVLPALPESALAGRRWIDVGSGAGLPGIPLAIARPDLDMTLVDAVEKKSAFQRQAGIELGLANLAVRSGRVEDMSAGGFDCVISRAFAELADFVRLAGHLAAPGGRLLAMKGLDPHDEITRLPAGWKVDARIPLAVPGLDAQRHLIVMERG